MTACRTPLCVAEAGWRIAYEPPHIETSSEPTFCWSCACRIVAKLRAHGERQLEMELAI